MSATLKPEHGAVIPLFLILAIAIAWVWWLFSEKQRRESLAALAEKYHLEVNPERPIAPDPDIRGFVFAAGYTRYVQGRIRGIPVVAFDYNIGIGRSRQLGTCVGVQRRLHDPVGLAGKLVPAVVDGWTFLYTYGLFRGRLSLDAKQIESLWERLLTAPAYEEERLSPSSEVPGGLVIKPRKPLRSS